MGLAQQFLQDANQVGGTTANGPLSAQFVQDSASSSPSPSIPPVVGSPMSGGERLMKGLNDISAAGGQLLLHSLPTGAVDAVNKATAYVNNLPVIGPVTQALGMVPATSQEMDKQIADDEVQYQANRRASAQNSSGPVNGQAPNPGIDWWRMGGNAIGAIPAAIAAAEAGGSGLLASTLTGAGSGAAQAALTQPVTSGDFWTEKGKQAALGGAAGAVGNLAGRALASAISPSVRPEVQTLMDSGVTPTPGQILGGGAQRVEDASTSIPFLGDMVKNAQRRAIGQFNDAAVNKALAPIGDKLPSGVTGRAAIDYADKSISNAYDTALSKIGSVNADPQFAQEINNLGGMMQNAPKDRAQQFATIIKNEIASRMNNGAMTAEGFKAADSNIGQIARGYLRSQDYDTQTLGQALLQAQSSMRDMLQRSAPPALSQDLSNANLAFANFLRPQRAASSLGADVGVFTPEQLQGAVKALDPSKRKINFSTGSALMQDLSEAGKTVLGSKVPDSGTPIRGAVLTGGALALGHGLPLAGPAAIPAAAGMGFGALPYTPLGQRLAAQLLTQRPSFAPQLANALRQLTPYSGAVAVPVAASQR